MKPYISWVKKLARRTTLPQVAPWLAGVYWKSQEKGSPLLRVAFRKTVNSLTWSLLRAHKFVTQGKLNRKEEEMFIFPVMIQRTVIAIPAIILGT